MTQGAFHCYWFFLPIFHCFWLSTVSFSTVFHLFRLAYMYSSYLCVCLWKSLMVCLSSSPLSINFSIFDGIAHAHRWIRLQISSHVQPTFTAKEIFSLRHKPDEQSERGHTIHVGTSRSDGAIVKRNKIQSIIFLSICGKTKPTKFTSKILGAYTKGIIISIELGKRKIHSQEKKIFQLQRKA